MATITTTLAAGSNTSPYFFDARITKQLCARTPDVPVFTPVFKVLYFKPVGTSQYEAVINVQGIVTFTPCGSRCARSQTINENFVIPFFSAAAPSEIVVNSGIPTNTLTSMGCSKFSNSFLCDVPLTLIVTTA